MDLEKARVIAEQLERLLEPACDRIALAGSIRRQKPEVGDIELLCIPRYVDGVDQLDSEIGVLMFQHILGFRRNKLGSKVYGPKNKLLVHLESGIGVDIFSTTEECWPVALVVRTGSEKVNKEIASRALERGMKFRAYGDGFDTPEGHIRCQTEADVFRLVGLRYLEPWERN